MARLIRKRLKGTILEPMIALIIILFSLTASMTVAIQANQRNNLQQRSRASGYADHVMDQMLAVKRYLPEEYQENGLKISKEIKWYSEKDRLLQISVYVYDNRGRLLSERQKIIIANENIDE